MAEKQTSFEKSWRLYKTKEARENERKAKEAMKKIIEMGTDRK